MYGGGLVVAAESSDGEIVETTFARLSDRHLDRCYSLAGYLLGDAAEAEDAAQDAMVRAWTSRRSLRDPAAFEAWLDRILVNTCMDRMRRRSIVRFVPIESEAESGGHDPFRDFLARDEMGRALEALGPEQRAVVVLRFWLDLSVDDIAARLGCPAGTVKSRLHKAMAVLRERMDRDAGEVRR